MESENHTASILEAADNVSQSMENSLSHEIDSHNLEHRSQLSDGKEPLSRGSSTESPQKLTKEKETATNTNSIINVTSIETQSQESVPLAPLERQLSGDTPKNTVALDIDMKTEECDAIATSTTNQTFSMIVREVGENIGEPPNTCLEESGNSPESHLDYRAQLEKERSGYEQQLEQLRVALAQKDSMIALFQRENGILEKEKSAFRKEKELATKEKESIVIKFAMKEKLLLDAKKEKEGVEKQLADARKEIKNITTRFQVVNEEKSRITYIIEEKCNEVRKYQRECEKLKTDCGHLESKLKYYTNKLQMETDAKNALEKKLEQERNAPNKLEERANEKLKMEYEANTILLKHEITSKNDIIENLTKENKRLNDLVKQLHEQVEQETEKKEELMVSYEFLQDEHTKVQNAYSEEMLNSAKLRGQLDQLPVLQAQNRLNEEKISSQESSMAELQSKLEDNALDLEQLRKREIELLTFNKEMSESIVGFQNEISLLKSKAQGVEAENDLLKKEKLQYDEKYQALEMQLKAEIESKNEERQILTKHLSEKTKLYENTKLKLDNILGDYDAAKHKHATELKELQRELQKYKKMASAGSQFQQYEAAPSRTSAAAAMSADSMSCRLYCSNCHGVLGSNDFASNSKSCETRPSELESPSSYQTIPLQRSPSAHSTATLSRHNSTDEEVGHRQQRTQQKSCSSRLPSESSESDTVISNSSSKITLKKAIPAKPRLATTTTTTPTMSDTSSILSDDSKGPSKKHLVERILRLQQASARQAEKIDFLEQHSLALVAELQKKSKVVQYYMLRDQAGALTSTKSDQHKSELTKYGNGVMSAIYGGIKPDNKSMTLDLSLEINKKLQAVLEDTLLKNITLKENLDVLGLEVDNLTRKLRQMEAKR